MSVGSPGRLPNHEFPAAVRQELDALARTDDWHSLLAVGVGFAIIALATATAVHFPWLYPLAIVLIGSRQRALTTILHDAAHGRAATRRWLNRLVGSQLSGYLIFQAFQPYRQSHVILHHGHLGEEAHDPDFQLYLDARMYDGMTRRQFFVRHVLATLTLANSFGYLRYLVRHRWASLTANKTELAGMIAFWSLLASAIQAAGAWDLFLLYWIVPFLTSFLVIGRFIEIAEHYPLLGSAGCKSILHATRNRFSHPVEACFFSMHHENYHLVHHLRPAIPFWNVAKAHRAMMADPAYAQVNAEFGGIFASSNGRPALIPALVSGKIALPQARARPEALLAPRGT